MKKYLLIVTVIAMGLSIAACTGKKAEKAADEPVKQEEVATPKAAGDNDVLAKYESLVNKVIEIQGKVAKGDAASVEELTKLNGELTSLAADLQNAAANFTPEQTQKYTELMQKLAAAATQNAPKP